MMRIFQVLFHKFSDIQNEIKTILLVLLENNHDVMLKDKVIERDFIYQNGRIPLHYAACQGDKEIMKILILKNLKSVDALTIVKILTTLNEG